MVLILVERVTRLTVDQAWRRLTDWPRHGAVVPLTRVSVLTPQPTAEGTVFVARTGLGPLTFDDPMRVARWRPPTLCRLVKQGRLVTGWAEIEVHPLGTEGSRVVWREDLAVRLLPALFDGLLGWAGRRMFGRAVDGLLARDPGPGVGGDVYSPPA
ncbi:SRPBCC family protein [Streptomyces sp. NPDC093228]|uniref:SRPBCC family protein n=1 Tax=unclassified Streptomyces TaxID=2593676 RepID=UPI000E255571|nr:MULTISPECIES: SRPBCC family protein [unclassified Streptomyces]MDX3259916.1 SRPBCC family protein [Streptomyces sp. MI02-2A]